jgi:hypothetical protein
MGMWSSVMMRRRVLHRQATEYIRGPMPNGEFPKARNGIDSGALWWDRDDPGGERTQGRGWLARVGGRHARGSGDTPHNCKPYSRRARIPRSP